MINGALSRKTCVAVFALVACFDAWTVGYAASTECNVGREGRVTLILPDPGTTAKPFASGDDVRVWIAGQKSVPAGWEYDLRYVPQEAGEFDLSGYLIAPKPAGAIQSILVRAETTLPDDSGKLVLTQPENPIRYFRYRILTFAGFTIWLLGCIWLLLARRKQIVEPPVVSVDLSTPTDEDRIKALAGKAFSDSLSNDDALELERLLRASLARVSDPRTHADDAVTKSWAEDQSLETMLERWFYSPRGITQAEMALVIDHCRVRI